MASRATRSTGRGPRSDWGLPVVNHGQEGGPALCLWGRATEDFPRGTPARLSRHPDPPRVWVSNPTEFLTTEDVWAGLLQNVNPAMG